MCNLSNAQSTAISSDMAQVHSLVEYSTLAKDNLATAKELFGDEHPITRLAHSLYLQSVKVATERYRLMALNTTAYMDAVLA